MCGNVYLPMLVGKEGSHPQWVWDMNECTSDDDCNWSLIIVTLQEKVHIALQPICEKEDLRLKRKAHLDQITAKALATKIHSSEF